MLLVLIPLAGPLITVFYGPDFAPSAVPSFQLLLGVMIFDVLATPLLLLPLAYRQARLLAAADAARAIVLVLVALAAIPVFGPFGAIAGALRVAGCRRGGGPRGAVAILAARSSTKFGDAVPQAQSAELLGRRPKGRHDVEILGAGFAANLLEEAL